MNNQPTTFNIPPKGNEMNGMIEIQLHEIPQASPYAKYDFIWKKVNIIAKARSKKKKDIPIIINSEGRVKSGECLAILGSTGAGKTTLLNYLSRKIESKNLQMAGEITLNGKELDMGLFSNISSYVMQDDILESSMTPTEILLFSAKLKLNLPSIEIENKVRQMIVDLHLTKCLNTHVGNAFVRGVSGGERKRTSIGVELISDPTIIFLDEPTTGLDSYNAYEIIQLLNKLSRQGKIVIFTIHQPASEIFGLLDKLCIMALGKTVYFGSKDMSYEYFEMMKLPVRLNYNPFEHFLEVTNLTSVETEKILSIYPEVKEIQDTQARYSAYISILNSGYQDNLSKYEDKSTFEREFSDHCLKQMTSQSMHRGYFYQFMMLFGRTMIINRRKLKQFGLKILQALFTAILIAALFVRLSKSFSGIQDRIGVMFLSMTSAIMGNNTATLLAFSEERKVFTRERANQLYSVFIYFISKTLSEFPSTFLMIAFYSLVVYWSTELNDTYSWKYYSFIGILLLGSFVGSGYSYIFGAVFTNEETIISVNTAFIIPMLLLSGFFANSLNFAPYLIPFEYLSGFKYTFQALVHVEFSNNQPLYCFNMHPSTCSPVQNLYQFKEPFYVSIIGLAALIVFFRIIAFILLYFLAKIKV